MNTAKKAVYAAVGAGSQAVVTAKQLPKLAAKLPQIVTEKAGSLSQAAAGTAQLVSSLPRLAAGMPKRASEMPKKAGEMAFDAAGRARTLAEAAAKDAVRLYGEYADRGEKLLSGKVTQKPANGYAAANGTAKPTAKKATKPKAKGTSVSE